MTESTETTRTAENRPETNWNVEYDVEPIRIRDPVAEALAVVEPGEPLVITYEDVVTAAGHSCPTAAGAYRIAQRGLDALYPDPDELPVRGDVEVVVGGPRSDPSYGVASRLVSYVTGAAGEDGFGGLAGGYGGRKNTMQFTDFDTANVAFEFRRTDADESADADESSDAAKTTDADESTDAHDSVRVTYHVGEIPDAGPAVRHLQKIVEGTATDEEREEFAGAWHGRVQTVLSDDDLFTVEATVDESG